MKLTILLPVRNETLNLKIMLKILRATIDVDHEVLVVCDTPNDASVAVVEAMRPDYPYLRLVLNEDGRGVAQAIRAGVQAAACDVVLIFAADEVGPILSVEDMFLLVEEGCDLVSCTLYAYGGRRLGWSAIGGFLSRTANWLFRRIALCSFSDATTGIKMFRRDVFPLLDLQSTAGGWAIAFEMAIKAQLKGLRLGEVPIISIDRLYGGQSTFRLGPSTAEYFRWFLWGLPRLLRRGRVPVAVRIPISIPVPQNASGVPVSRSLCR